MGTARRKRAPRGTLSRDRIVDAALELIDADGVDGLSMPKLARRMGAGTMSLYNHVDSKDDLLDAVAQRVLQGLPTPAGADWSSRLRAHFHDLRAALIKHPGLGMVLATKNVAVPAVFDLLERTLADLTAAGLDDETSAHLYYDLLAYTLGFVAWELPRTRSLSPGEYRQRWRDAVNELPPEKYPTIHRLLGSLTSVASHTQFEHGLQRIVESSASHDPPGRR